MLVLQILALSRKVYEIKRNRPDAYYHQTVQFFEQTGTEPRKDYISYPRDRFNNGNIDQIFSVLISTKMIIFVPIEVGIIIYLFHAL